jgi:phenylpropionate dioxygenase-like ring-hydroxylating dioxygenase large terminal subunit
MTEPIESIVLNEWHVLGAVGDLPAGSVRRRVLFGEPLAVLRYSDDTVGVWRYGAHPDGPRLPSRLHCGHVWTSLGAPEHEPFAVPEFSEPDRRRAYCGSFGVHVSAPRAVENFLDMGHFPFVHGGVLGELPHTEVKDYDVAVSDDGREVVATRCRFYQPLSALSAKQGFEVEYVYRVPHPYCAVLYKSAACDPGRNDVIAIFARPISEEHISASLFMALVDEESTDVGLSHFQQMIFGQDKPILENQRPRRLPLDPTAEIAVRADRMSVAYRRWLHERGVRYGTVPWERSPRDRAQVASIDKPPTANRATTNGSGP